MSTVEPTREQWLAERRKGIGASEAAAVLGKHPWQTPLELYLRKVGLIPDSDSTPIQEWGLRMEPVIAEAYTEKTGLPLVRYQNKTQANPDAPWMLATLDYASEDGPVEIKRVIEYGAEGWGEEGTEEVPFHYWLQVQQQMAVAGGDKADLAVLIGHCDFRIYTVRRNQECIEKLIIAERDFMGMVARQEPPLPDFTHPTTLDILNMIEPAAGTAIDLPDKWCQMADLYELLGSTARDASKSRDAIKAMFAGAMGTAEEAVLPDGRKLRRTMRHRKGYTVESTDYVHFEIKKPKSKEITNGNGATRAIEDRSTVGQS